VLRAKLATAKMTRPARTKVIQKTTRSYSLCRPHTHCRYWKHRSCLLICLWVRGNLLAI